MAKNPIIPPLDPNRHSTNKRVKVGVPSRTSAKVVKVVPTAKQVKVAAMIQRANKNAAVRAGVKAVAAKEIKKTRGVISPLVDEALRKANKVKGGVV